MKAVHTLLLVVLAAGTIALPACGDGGGNGDSDASTDTDSDTDSDTDADGGSDTDTDSDSDCVYPDVVEDCTDGWCTILSGCFTMGSPVEELGRWENEVQHQVTLTFTFVIGEYEVTQGDFEVLMGWNPSAFTSCGESCPVETVSRYDAMAYANALSTSEGLTPCYVLTDIVCGDATDAGTDALDCMNATQGGILAATEALNGASIPQECEGYRLPTESEWEYAIRAGSTTALYPSDGNDGSFTNINTDPNLDQIAWYFSNSSYKTQAVGDKEPNAWGLYDMNGNVYELVWDRFEDYPTEPTTDPTGAQTGLDAWGGRGCCWGNPARFCRSAARNGGDPGYRDNHIGFRLARSFL